MTIPEVAHGNHAFWERIATAQEVTRKVSGRRIRFFVQSTRADCIHACTVDDIAHLMSFVPVSDWEGIQAVVLRQPRRKEEVLASVWGRRRKLCRRSALHRTFDRYPTCLLEQGRLSYGRYGQVQFFRDRLAVEAKAYLSLNDKKCQALFSEFRANETWQVPTLTVLRLWGHLDDSRFLADSRRAYIDKRFRDHWEERTRVQRLHWNNAEYELARELFAMDERVTRAMFLAGVPMMAGTDAMNPYCFPGFSLHDELALLVESGIPPLAALQMATINPAKFLGRAEEMCTIEPGKLANLVLLGADPLADIGNTTRIEAVWLRGKYFDKAALVRILAQRKPIPITRCSDGGHSRLRQ